MIDYSKFPPEGEGWALVTELVFATVDRVTKPISDWPLVEVRRSGSNTSRIGAWQRIRPDCMEDWPGLWWRPAAADAVADLSAAVPVRLDRLDDDLVEILGMPCFRAGPIAHLFVAAGEAKIATKAEAEQAFVLHWLLRLWFQHGAGWRQAAGDRIRAMQTKLKEAA